MRYARPLFKPKDSFVAVRRFNLAPKIVVEPGQDMADFNLRQFHLRSLYKRKFIGVKDHPWTVARRLLPSSVKPELSINRSLEPVPVREGDKWTILGIPTDKRFTTRERAVKWYEALLKRESAAGKKSGKIDSGEGNEESFIE